MRIAVISDIHGNLEALNTVIKDIKNKKIDKIYCIGDILAKGSKQQECINMLIDNCDVIVKGNCDEYYTNDINLIEADEKTKNRYNWINNKLNDKTKELIKNLPYCHEFYLSGRLVRLLHAHPKKINNFVRNIDNLENYYSLFLPSENTISDKKADIVVYGHIHTPYIQKIYNRYIINAGSVGNAIDTIRNEEKDGNIKSTTVANYVVLTGELDSTDFNNQISFELVSVPYDIAKEKENNKDNIELDEYFREIEKGEYRYMEVINRTFKDRGVDKDKI